MTAELPWTSVGVGTDYRELRGFSRQVPRVMALPRQMPRCWPRHVAAVLSVAHSVVPTMATHGNSWKMPRQFPRPSAAIATATRQSPRKSVAIARAVSADVQSNSETISRPSAAIRVHCHGDPPIRGDFHESTWESAAIATARAAVLSVANSVVPIMPTASRTRGRESCGAFYRGCFSGPIHGCPRTFPQTSPWVFP